MELVLLCGLQATGKSTFCKERLYHTHVRLNLDMLRTRHRENSLYAACIDAKQPVVIDNTNPTVADRARYIAPAKVAGFKVVGYYFESRLEPSLARNAGRPERERVPELGLKATAARLERPSLAEGFDQLWYVRIADGGFDVQEWSDEV